MKTDRELLELAAKAAGYEVLSYDDRLDELVCKSAERGTFIWSPRKDDGDALRLACTLGLSVDINNAFYRTTVIYEFGDDLSEDHVSGTAAATRRAIVRAAAAIGETL